MFNGAMVLKTLQFTIGNPSAFISVFIDNHNYVQPDMYWNVDRGWVR